MRPCKHGLPEETPRQRKRRERHERKAGDRARLKEHQRPIKRRVKNTDEGQR